MEAVYGIIALVIIGLIVRYAGVLGAVVFWGILIVCAIVVIKDFNWGALSAWLGLQTILRYCLKENIRAKED